MYMIALRAPTHSIRHLIVQVLFCEILIATVSGAAPHIYFVHNDVFSPDDYFGSLDSSGNVLQRMLLPGRALGFGMTTDGESLVLPFREAQSSEIRLKKFGLDGSPQGDALGPNAPDLFGIGSHAVGTDGSLYHGASLLYPNASGGLERLNPDGSRAWLTALPSLLGVTVTQATEIYTSHYNEIRKLSADGQLLATYRTSFFWGGAVDIDEAGGLLYLGHQPGDIVVFDMSLGDLRFVRSFPSGLPGIFDISVDHFSGNIIASGIGGLTELTPDGNLASRYFANDILRSLPASALARDADFNLDRGLDVLDMDVLVASIAAGTSDVRFDVSHDGLVNYEDALAWLSDAGWVSNPTGSAFLVGDADLDGVVDGHDFNLWNANKFSDRQGWSNGDFDANGVIDLEDFNLWNTNKFRSVGSSIVPEPSSWCLCLLVSVFVAKTRK
jgi:hypothetical protein